MMISASMPQVKHTFNQDASILSNLFCKLPCMNFGERLQIAIEQAGSSRDKVADATGTSVQAIGQCIRGETKALTAENTARAARLLGVSAYWLATGDGPMKDQAPLPFSAALHKKLFELSPTKLVQLEKTIWATLEMLAPEEDPPAATTGAVGLAMSAPNEPPLSTTLRAA